MSAGAVPLFRSSATPGFLPAIAGDPRCVRARKLVNEIQVRFADTPCLLKTNEGEVHVRAGDAIVTGIAGEHWRVSRSHFADKYDPVAPTVAGQAGRYRSRPIGIICMRMSEPFQVQLADGISHLSGRVGDWLVDYGDGSLGIVSPAIFATTYELLG